MSATARLITRHMLRFRSLGSLRYTMIVKAFIVTIATDSVPNNASQAMHPERESSGSTVYTKRKKREKKKSHPQQKCSTKSLHKFYNDGGQKLFLCLN